MKKPAREAWELALMLTDYAEVMAAVENPRLRDLLELAWESGARPQELTRFESRFYDAANNRLVFSLKEAKGKKHHWIIYLGSERAREIDSRLAAENPIGPILLNTEGRPWMKDAIYCAFCRIQ